MVRKTSHRYRVGLVPTRQRQAKDASSDLGIAEEQFIEVSHAKEQQGVTTGLFGLMVLFHHGSCHAANVAIPGDLFEC